MPADTLVDEIWGDEPPEKTRNIIQTYISHLRKALGHDRIQSHTPGYRLEHRVNAARRAGGHAAVFFVDPDVDCRITPVLTRTGETARFPAVT